MKKLAYLLVSILLYLFICRTPTLEMIAWPISMLCTFLHEFGHAFFSIISGGTVHSLAVNTDGSGVTTTSGGSQGLCTIGGYVGSALFGNLMLWLSGSKWSSITLKVIAGAMFIASILWFDNIVTTAILFFFSVGLFFISMIPFNSFMLSFLGVACVIYIIQDFDVGPTSDLQAYEQEVGLFPAGVWMYIWLGIVLASTAFTLWKILTTNNNYEQQRDISKDI